MVYVYSGSNTTAPVGPVRDYNNTNPSRAVGLYRILTPNINQQMFETQQKTSFAMAIYGDGPYSLSHPNVKSDILAQNTDYIA